MDQWDEARWQAAERRSPEHTYVEPVPDPVRPLLHVVCVLLALSPAWLAFYCWLALPNLGGF